MHVRPSRPPHAVARIGIAPANRGCGARIQGIALQADAAFYSTWGALSKRMSSLFDSKAWPRRTMSSEASAFCAQQRRLTAGILVDLEGAVRFTPDAELLYNSTPFKGDFPVREGSLQSSPIIAAVRTGGWMPGRVPRRMIVRICKHLDALTAA